MRYTNKIKPILSTIYSETQISEIERRLSALEIRFFVRDLQCTKGSRTELFTNTIKHQLGKLECSGSNPEVFNAIMLRVYQKAVHLVYSLYDKLDFHHWSTRVKQNITLLSIKLEGPQDAIKAERLKLLHHALDYYLTTQHYNDRWHHIAGSINNRIPEHSKVSSDELGLAIQKLLLTKRSLLEDKESDLSPEKRLELGVHIRKIEQVLERMGLKAPISAGAKKVSRKRKAEEIAPKTTETETETKRATIEAAEALLGLSSLRPVSACSIEGVASPSSHPELARPSSTSSSSSTSKTPSTIRCTSSSACGSTPSLMSVASTGLISPPSLSSSNPLYHSSFGTPSFSGFTDISFVRSNTTMVVAPKTVRAATKSAGASSSYIDRGPATGGGINGGAGSGLRLS